jgi:uncharacterized protein YndB with AHSA1/START domain
VIDRTVQIQAPPEVVWRFFTDPARMARWLGPATLDPRPGGGLAVALIDGPTIKGEYVELVPFSRLVFTFGWDPAPGLPDLPPGSSRVEVTFEATGEGTTLRLRHTGVRPDLAARTDDGWAGFLATLAGEAHSDAGAG